MNSVIIDSWYFFKNNFKELCSFMLPLFALGIVGSVISTLNPQSGILSVLTLLQFILGPLFTGGILLLIANLSNGQTPAHKDMLAQAMPLWLSIFLVSMMTALAAMFGFFLFILPGIFFLVRLYLAPLYVVFQEKSVSDAISTSFNDSKDHMLPFFQVMLPFAVLGIVYYSIIASLGKASPGLLLSVLLSLGTVLVFIFSGVVQYRLYSVYIEKQEPET